MAEFLKPSFAKPNKKLIFPDAELTKENLGELCRIFDALSDYYNQLYCKDLDYEDLTHSGEEVDLTGLMDSPVAPFVRALFEEAETYLSLMGILYGALVGEMPDHQITHALYILDKIKEVENDTTMSAEEKEQELKLLKTLYPHRPGDDPFKHQI